MIASATRTTTMFDICLFEDIYIIMLIMLKLESVYQVMSYVAIMKHSSPVSQSAPTPVCFIYSFLL